MVKTVRVYLDHVDFDDSAIRLGSDYVFDFFLDGKTTTVSAKVVKGKPIIPRQKLFDLNTSSIPTTIPLKILIKESDLIDDTGSVETKVELDFSDVGENTSVIQVRVDAHGRESAPFGTVTIHLTFILEEGIRYVTDIRPQGWLSVKTDNDAIILLPYYLKVEVTHVDDNREYFIIREGPYEGKRASVKIKPNFESYLGRTMTHDGPAHLVFESKKAKLTIPGLGEYFAITMASNPIAPGVYNLEVPDHPHEPGNIYVSQATHARTWFRIGGEGDRYLHPGLQSAGCITVRGIEDWEEIYNKLIKCRKDSKNIGTMEVK